MQGVANGDAHLLEHASETPLPQAAAAAGHGCRTTTRRLNYTALPALTRSDTISNPNYTSDRTDDRPPSCLHATAAMNHVLILESFDPPSQH